MQNAKLLPSETYPCMVASYLKILSELFIGAFLHDTVEMLVWYSN